MKKRTILSLIFIALLVTACMNVGTKALRSDNFETKTYDLDNFSGIAVAEGIDVVLHKSNENRAEATSNFMEYLIVEVDDEGTLNIHFDKPSFTNLGNDETKVDVWAVDVKEFTASSSGSLLVDGIFTNDVQTIDVSSSGKVDYDINAKNTSISVRSSGKYEGVLEVSNLEASASSSGKMELKGSADYAQLNASSSGKISGEQLTVNKVDANASSSGKITIKVNQELNAKASSSGDIYYIPNKDIKLLNIDESSSGKVRPRNQN